jgi:hypothetical protein
VTPGTGEPGTLAYVYAVGRDGGGLEAAVHHARRGAAGVAGAPVHLVGAAGLAAVVGAVPAQEFGAAGLRTRLDDLGALETLARAHHGVVAALFGTVTVLPMRLATVYADEAKVTGMLTERAGTFDAMLRRLDGNREWGVKVYADPRADVPQPSTASPAGGPGRAYLQQRRSARDARQRILADARWTAGRVAELAAVFAVDRAVHRPQDPALATTLGAGAGRAPGTAPGENVANLAFLVPAERGEEFHAALAALDVTRPGVRVEVTGPWAPYSFAATDPAGDADVR